MFVWPVADSETASYQGLFDMLWWCVEDGCMILPPMNSTDVDSFHAVVNYRVWVNLPLNSILLRIDFSFFKKKICKTLEDPSSAVNIL